MIILVPWFGDVYGFKAHADAWAEKHDASKEVWPFRYLTDTALPCEPRLVERHDISGFKDVIRPGQPFDVKGALVCAALLEHEDDSILVLDLDATLAGDTSDVLIPHLYDPICMPIDAGAITHGRHARLAPPFEHIQKLCAGVMFFGVCPGRGRLVAAYRKAWHELKDVLPWDPPYPHLLEQYAWSLALRRRGGSVLPATMNWSPRHLGESAFAVVNHDYGLAKWRE